MSLNDKRRRKFSGVTVSSRSTWLFICIDPSQQATVFDFLKDGDPTKKEVALIHLRLCLKCRETAATVLKIDRHLEDSHHAEESEVDATENSTVDIGKTETHSQGNEEYQFADEPF